VAEFPHPLCRSLCNYKVLASNLNQVSEIDGQLPRLRRHEKDFLARSDTRHADKFAVTQSDLLKQLDELEPSLSDSGVPTTTIDPVRVRVTAYGAVFTDLVNLQRKIGLHAKDGLYGRLRKAVYNAEAEFTEQQDYELISHMLMLQRAEKDFMLRRTTDHVDRFNVSFDNLRGALRSAAMTDDARRRASEFMDGYERDFLALVDAERELGLTHKDGTLGQLRAKAHAVESRLDNFESELRGQIATASSRKDVLL
jgi:methyl-accepting chemotaxis protein